MTSTRTQTGRHMAAPLEELSPAQRSAVSSEARVTVVQGGPGSGKTEASVARAARLIAQRQNPESVMVLLPSEPRARAFQARLRRALTAVRCSERIVSRALSSVTTVPALFAGLGGRCRQPLTEQGEPGELGARISEAAGELAPELGLPRRVGEVRELLVETVRRLASRPADDGVSEAECLRRGVAFIEESVRLAQSEALRRLRMLAGGDSEELSDLVRGLRRPSDVTARARELRSSLDRACRAGASSRAELERARSFVDVAAIDLAEAARREAAAATARVRVQEVARELLRDWRERAGAGFAEGSNPEAQRSTGGREDAPPLFGAARHVIVDDAHDLAGDELALLRQAGSAASLFITGDQRSATSRDGGLTHFRTLLRDAGRAVVLLEAPRFGAGIGRFVNALGARLWPPTDPGGYAPAISRLDFDPSAADSIELWLVHRRGASGEGHPEPIVEARRREADAVAAAVRPLAVEGAAPAAAIMVQHEAARELFVAAIEAAGLSRDRVAVLTMDEALGLEWPTVFVTGLDEPLGGPPPRRGWLDAETGLATVWPTARDGRRICPFSSLLLAQGAALARDAAARQRLFQAVARARTRVVLSGATRDVPAGGESCVAPIEWLRRQLGVVRLAPDSGSHRFGEASVRVRVLDAVPMAAA